MKKIEVLNRPNKKEELERLQKILEERGYEATLKQCEDLWGKYSESMSAGWMWYLNPESRYTDEDIFRMVKPFFSELDS